MSPVSRARKKPPQPVTHSVTGLFKDILNDFSALGADPEPVDVELLASEVLGQFHDLPADAGLQVVLGRGIPQPAWAAGLGRVTAGDCWRTGDVFGDESSLLCVFSHG